MNRVALTLGLLLVASSLGDATAAPGPWPGWDRLAEPEEAALRRARVQQALDEGDELVLQAVDVDIAAERVRLLARAKRAYQAAIAADPDAGEPYYRLARTLLAFFVECDHPTLLCNPRQLNKPVAREALGYLERFDQVAPLDPRGTHLLDDRAILATKLEDFTAAIRSYEVLLDRLAVSETGSRAVAEGNLAETYMMVGRLDEAIELYRWAAAGNGRASTVYGLAVALDRDGRGSQAREAIAQLGPSGLASFEHDLAENDIFYVPAGEAYYYLALAHEALGNPQAAIAHYDRFLRSGAHPRFQPRARANRDALARRRSP